MELELKNDRNFRRELEKEDSNLSMVLASMPDWHDKDVSLACFTGGLSNQVYRIEVDNEICVARIPSRVSNILGGNYEAEVCNTELAGTLGVGPRVLKFIEDLNCMILEYIEGIPLTTQLLSDDRVVRVVVDTFKKLHHGPSFCNIFSMSVLINQYIEIIPEQGLAKLDGFRGRYSSLVRIRSLLESRSAELAPCHNDAFPKNWILERGNVARLIDFEFSGNNDPAFDLATIYVEAGYSDAQLHELCKLYYGEQSQKNVSRVWLHSILFDIGWALYVLVKSSVATDADKFSDIAVMRWKRACAKLDSQDFERQMSVVTES